MRPCVNTCVTCSSGGCSIASDLFAEFCTPPTQAELTTSCNQQPCPTYAFVQKPASNCSAACGTGYETFNVDCIQTIGDRKLVVASSLCPGRMPDKVQICNGAACSTATYITGPWKTCSKTCGGGTSVRTVTCLKPTGNNTLITDESGTSCSDLVKPAESRACSTSPCETVWWEVAPWGECSAPCGGKRQRSASCKCGFSCPKMHITCHIVTALH